MSKFLEMSAKDESTVLDQAAPAADLVKLFRALGDRTRLEIVRLLLVRDELACAELQQLFPLSRPALAHHTRVLTECGILTVRKEGSYHFFTLRREALGPIMPDRLVKAME
jgi:DNA-binding transcriptional ArsR family regulator